MDIVLSLMLFIAGGGLTSFAVWRSFDINIGGAVEKSRAVAQTAVTGSIGLSLVTIACAAALPS